MSYLRRYPIQVLKLDTSYTQALPVDPETRIIAEAIVTMARRLGITHVLVRHDVLLDYGRSVLVDDARPLAQNVARLNLARSFLVDGTTVLRVDRKFLLAALPPAR